MAVVAAVAVVVVGYLVASGSLGGARGTNSSSPASHSFFSVTATAKPVILYVNQGNGEVNTANFGLLLDVATSHGFNTLFFQVYRSGTLLFDDSSLLGFVKDAHGAGLKIYFALYFTNSSQAIPASVYADGEDGISLDMSTLPASAQAALFDQLSAGFSGSTAITTLDPGLSLKPNLLVVETYSASDRQYIHPGMVAGVEAVATSGQQDYQQQVQYALANSDGVMVFDYAGLLKTGY